MTSQEVDEKYPQSRPMAIDRRLIIRIGLTGVKSWSSAGTSMHVRYDLAWPREPPGAPTLSKKGTRDPA
ncbi:MAG TPA: hypothetical protein VJO34_06305 [Methylomirabilota bacterium]|nr:hypothetical protein [Methylomirabilota bacterium]